MVKRIARWGLKVILGFAVSVAHQASGQNFGDCQAMTKDLLQVFNQSFEENNPALLHSVAYRQKLKKLQNAYNSYNIAHFSPADSVSRLNNEAVILALNGSYHKALRILESLDLSTQNPDFIYNRGLLSLLNGKYTAARHDFETTSSNPMAALNSLFAIAKEKKYQEGIEYASSSTGVKNAKGKWSYNLGLLYKATNQFTEAEIELSGAIRQKDDIFPFRLQRGDILMRMGNEKKAVKDFEKVARKHPKAQIRYANALLSLNQFENARLIFEKYLGGRDRSFRGDAYYGMGHAYYGLNNIPLARRYYKLALTMRRETAGLQSGIANTHLSKHEYQSAFNLFDRVLQKDSAYYHAYLGRAVANYGLKRYELALTDFDKAASLLDENNKSHADLFVTKGFSEYYTRQNKRAEETFSIAIRLDPGRYEALAGMSSIRIDQKKYSDAGQYLNKALSYHDQYDRMWSNYGNLLLHFDMYKKGYEVFKKAVGLNPSNVNAQNGWGIVLLENDQLDRSRMLFDSLIKSNPGLPFLHNNHGIVQTYLGNRHEQRHEANEAHVRYNGAYADFARAMDVAPARKFYNVNQGNVFRYWNKFDEAKLSYQSYQDKSALNNTAVMYAGREQLKDAKYYLGVAIEIDSLHRVFQYNMNVLVKGKQKEMMRLVASAGDNSPFSDISIKYSRDGFVTIYLYDYDYDTLSFPGRHYMPLPAAEYHEDYFIPEYDFKLLAYPKKEDKLVESSKKEDDVQKIKKSVYKSQKVRMPGKKGRSGTRCPVF
jgi:tetratricopeptide (TPR) repeat protein